MSQLKTILAKEFTEVAGNKLLVFTVIAPLVILPILPLAVAFTVNLDIDPITAEDVKLFIKNVPQWAGLPPTDVFQIVMMQQMMTLFLIIPLIIPMSIAAFSIIGEKKARTLEPLLATPVSTATILAGKAIAAGAPGLIATWASYGISLAGLRFMIDSPVVWRAIAGPVWWVAMGLVTPLLTFLSVMVGVIVSARVNDTRVAQQLGSVVVVPIVILSLGQATGFLLLNMATVLTGAAIALLLDGLALWVAVTLFERERILTRWTT